MVETEKWPFGCPEIDRVLSEWRLTHPSPFSLLALALSSPARGLSAALLRENAARTNGHFQLPNLDLELRVLAGGRRRKSFGLGGAGLGAVCRLVLVRFHV